MSGPRLKRRNYGRGHGYTIDGAKVPGVTSILNSLPKDALVGWAAKTTAAYAVDKWDELAAMPPSQRLKELEGARYNVTKEAALRGNQIHDLGEKVSHGLEVTVPDEHRGPVEAWARFLDEWEVEVIATEAPCANTKIRYAGTLDSVATIGRMGGEPVMLDIKTGRGIYESAALQLEAYARCDLWQPDGSDSEEPMPECTALYIAHVKADVVDLVPVIADREQLWRQFRYLERTSNWLAEAKDMPPLGAPIDIEEYAS